MTLVMEFFSSATSTLQYLVLTETSLQRNWLQVFKAPSLHEAESHVAHVARHHPLSERFCQLSRTELVYNIT